MCFSTTGGGGRQGEARWPTRSPAPESGNHQILLKLFFTAEKRERENRGRERREKRENEKKNYPFIRL